MTHNIDFTTSDVTVTFRGGGAGATITGTGTAKLIKISNGIGMLTYKGETGYNDTGTGSRQMRADWSSSVFTSVIGGAVNSYYGGNGDAYQQYCEIGNGYAETYVYKSAASNQMRRIQFVIIGTL